MCRACNPGQYSVDTNVDACISCEAGRSNVLFGQATAVACLLCPSDRHAPRSGLASCVTCDEGKQSATTLGVSCNLIPPVHDQEYKKSSKAAWKPRAALAMQREFANTDEPSRRQYLMQTKSLKAPYYTVDPRSEGPGTVAARLPQLHRARDASKQYLADAKAKRQTTFGRPFVFRRANGDL